MLKNREELKNLRQACGKKFHEEEKKILVCAGSGCIAGGSLKIFDRLKELIEAKGLDCKVEMQKDPHGDLPGLKKTGCHGFCQMGPLVRIEPQGYLYTKVQLGDCEEILDTTIVNGQPIDRLAYKWEGVTYPKEEEIPFYTAQTRLVLANCGHIDAEDINEYIAIGGYGALEKSLFEMTRDEVLDVVKASGIRGRGGAGFPTGVKWGFMKSQPDHLQKYVICNGDEGDPGAFMDRSYLEGNPHGILEAMAIAGYTMGSDKGFIYVRAEYPVAVKRLKIAIAQAKEMGLLGENILDSGFSFDIEIRLGAGAFVCGEETALIASIEGKRGMSRNKPPFPAIKGLWGKPSVINNVETLAAIPLIVGNGAEWFRQYGTEKSPGTKIFALGGKINNTGLVEISMGATLRDVIYNVGGGCPNGKEFKAVQTGGPSGGCITKANLDTPIDFDNLVAIGSMMGSGGMIVVDEDNCMVDIARFFLDFTVDESCGKCTPCREGTKRMLEILDKITEGKGTLEDLDLLEDLAENIKNTSLCALGQTAPNPVVSTMKHFRDEYIAHVVDKKCPAGVCQALLSYEITDKCKGCTLCSRKCPVGAISGTVKEQHVIDQSKCIKCGACMEACKFEAIIKK